MRLFFYKILLLGFSFIVVCTIIGFFFKSVILKNIYDEHYPELSDSISTLVLGDSHGLTSYDPKIIDSLFVAASNSENLIFTFYKAREFIAHNKQIKKVILNISFHNFSDANNFKSLRNISRYYPLLNYDDKQKLIHGIFNNIYNLSLKENAKLLFTLSIAFIKNDLGFPIDLRYELIKRAFNQKVDLVDLGLCEQIYRSDNNNVSDEEIRTTIEKQFYKNGKLSEIQVEYVKIVQDIIELVLKKNIKIYIVTTPLYSKYFYNVPEKFKKTYQSVCYSYKNVNVAFLDFSNSEFSIEYFGDSNHLNKRGMDAFYLNMKSLLSK